MQPRFLMSPPPRDWKIVGGQNFKSSQMRAPNPESAYLEWSLLVSAIHAAGGQVHALDPQKYTAHTLSGLMYAANWGRLFKGKNVFLLSFMRVPHRSAESEAVRAFLQDINGTLGENFEIKQSGTLWEGQADVADLPGNMHVLTHGPRSSWESVHEVSAFLVDKKETAWRKASISLGIQEPFFHGDTCMSAIATPRGLLLIIYSPAAVDSPKAEFVRLMSRLHGAEVVEVARDDALNYACNALVVNQSFIYPKGLSDTFLKKIEIAGLALLEIDMSNLFGVGGGGPRCLVNRLDSPFER